MDIKDAKRYVYITNPAVFLEHIPHYTIGMAMSGKAPDDPNTPKDWVYLTKFTIPWGNIDEKDIIKAALIDLDQQESSIRAELESNLNDLKQRRSAILALEHQPTIMDSEVSIG